MDPLVSIIIPVYNGANYLREAIDSALAQTYSNIEIIVVNDGSNDGGATRDISKSYGESIRYFEKENGGVSTALNLGIKNMRGQYFSWLSHDDIYLPEKVQVEVDALRKAGDMSRVVYSNFYELIMPEKTVKVVVNDSIYRQEFIETGAFATAFSFCRGCELLIPKFYFDAYGGFDPTFRGVQDYKKWFEILRGKRLIYIRKPLVYSRIHPQSTTNNYSLRFSESDWFRHWSYYNLNEDDIVGSGLTDLYHLYSALFTFRVNSPNKRAVVFLMQKIAEVPESPAADERVQHLDKLINNGTFKIFFPKEQESLLRLDFAWRGVNLGDNVKFIPFAQFASVKPANNVRLLTRESLMQVLIDAPIRKQLFTQWLDKQGGHPV